MPSFPRIIENYKYLFYNYNYYKCFVIIVPSYPISSINWANIAAKQAGHEIHFATSTNTSTGKSSFFMKDIYYSNYKERVKKKLVTKL